MYKYATFGKHNPNFQEDYNKLVELEIKAQDKKRNTPVNGK